MQKNDFVMNTCITRSIKMILYFNIYISLLNNVMQVQSNSDASISILLRRKILRNYSDVSY